ncbi:MAG: hypothetical protein R6U63_06165 [Longimicrobiales bacterium]
MTRLATYLPAALQDSVVQQAEQVADSAASTGSTWIEQATSLSPEIQQSIFLSLIIVAVIMAARALTLR